MKPGTYVHPAFTRDKDIEPPLGVVIKHEQIQYISESQTNVWVRWIGTENQFDSNPLCYDPGELKEAGREGV